MILLLGGTGETARIATALAEAGHDVLVSTATKIDLDTGRHPRIRRRAGRMDAAEMAALVRAESVRAIVDATHPYAEAAHAAARDAAAALGIPCLRYERPGSLDDAPRSCIAGACTTGASPASAAAAPCIESAATHDEAARTACVAGATVLLTTGSRNLALYVAAAKNSGARLFVRVLPEEESLAACAAAGIPAGDVIAARGPFAAEANLDLLHRLGVTVLVTKDSGDAGGLPAKLDAARRAGCRVVVVRRPAGGAPGGFASVDALLAALEAAIGRKD